jgi:hypothetical protein
MSNFVNVLMQNSQYHGAVFKVPMPFEWAVMVSGHDKIDAIRRAPDDVLCKNNEEALILCSRFHIDI